MALSTVEFEYIVVGCCYAQILWIKQQLEDFGLKVNKVPLFCDNISAINLTKNQIQHSRTKHIKFRHHFIRDHMSNGDYELQFINLQISSLSHCLRTGFSSWEMSWVFLILKFFLNYVFIPFLILFVKGGEWCGFWCCICCYDSFLFCYCYCSDMHLNSPLFSHWFSYGVF